MWNPEKIALISSVAIQKRLPFAISESEISNFIGNFSLAPDVVPVTKRTKYLLHALVKELLIQEKIVADNGQYQIPELIEIISSSIVEQCLVALDSILLPDYCVIKDKSENTICTLLQIHPNNGTIQSTCTLDFGLTEKQIIHLTSQKLIRIPVPQTPHLEITLSVQQGLTGIKLDIPIEIRPSSVGLVIDTRESDILLKSSAIQAKQYAIEWLQSFDVQSSDI